MRVVGPREEGIVELKELVRTWVPDLGLTGSLPVPAWFLMRRRPSQPRPQAAMLLAARAGADARVRLALWTMLAGSYGQRNGTPSVLQVPQAKLAPVLNALPGFGSDTTPRTKQEAGKDRNRQVYRAVETLEHLALLRGDQEQIWILRPGRGPHETEPWSTTMRPGREDDPVVEVPLSWFHHGWLNDLSGRAIVTLLTIHALFATSDYHPTQGDWFLVPRVRGSRLAMDRRTWNSAVAELRSHRLVERARVGHTGRGGVDGDEFAYRLLERDDAPLGRPRLGLPDVDAAKSMKAERLDLINRDPPGMRPVLYTPPYLTKRIFAPYSALGGIKWFLSVRPWSEPRAAFRIDPSAAPPGSDDWNDAVRALSFLTDDFDIHLQGRLNAGGKVGHISPNGSNDRVELQLHRMMPDHIPAHVSPSRSDVNRVLRQLQARAKANPARE